MATTKSSTANGEPPPKTTEDVSPQTLTLIKTLIIDEILPRLPVKPLIRFKSVCKTWKSAISNPHFIASHLKFSSAKHPQLIVQIDKLSDSLYYTLPYRERNSIYDLKWLKFRGAKDCTRHWIVDSFNGIVCVYHTRESRSCFFTLWNPATREVRDVACPEKVVGVADAVGFGYLPSVDDYFIVAYFAKFLKISNVGTFRGFFVLSVKAGKWESILGTYREFDKLDEYGSGKGTGDTTVKGPEYGGVMVGDTMYWTTNLFGCTKFVGFNVVTHEYKEYPLPDLRSDCWAMQLFRVNECLSLFCNGGTRGNEVCDFWMLKDPNVPSSWQRILAVDFNSEFLLVSNSGKCLLQQAEEGLELAVLSKKALERNRWYPAAFEDFPILYLKDYVESLISPFGGTIEANEEEKSTRGHEC